MKILKKNIKEAISNVEAMADATAVTTPVTAKLKKDMKKKYQDFEKITVSKDNFLGAKKQPLPKKVEVPKSQAKLDLDESLFETAPVKKNLKERNLTRAERHNRDMENIFGRYNKLKDDEAKFLISKGVSEDEVKELRKNTGLGRDALEDKMIELGVRDEFFNKRRISEAKKTSRRSPIIESKRRKSAKKLKESKKSLKEATYSDQLYDEIYSVIDGMDSSELAYTWNTYCDEANYPDDYLYSMDEIDEILDGQRPYDILKMAFYGNFNPADKYFRFDGYGNLVSYDYLIGVIEIDDMIDHIIERDSDLGSDDIRLTLDEFDEGEVEESLKESNDDTLNQKAKFAQKSSNDGNKRWVLSNDDGRIRLAGSEEELKKLQSKGYEIELVFQNGKDVTFDENLKESKDSAPSDGLLKEGKQQLNEGAGAGYTIKADIDIRAVNSLNIVSIKKDETYTDLDGGEFQEYFVETNCDIDATSTSISAHSYYYGDTINVETPCKINHMNLSIVAPKNTEIDSKNAVGIIEKAIIGERIGTDIVYGWGWSHSTYDGTLSNLDDEIDSHYISNGNYEITIRNIDAYITDDEIVDYIDKAVTDENKDIQYIVYDDSDVIIDYYDDEEYAISIADQEPGRYVEKQTNYYDVNGEWDLYQEPEVELIYTNDEPEDEPEDEEDDTTDVDKEVEKYYKYQINADESLQEARGKTEKKEKTPASKEEFAKKFPQFFYRDNISKEDKLGFEVSDLEDVTEFKKFAKEHGNKVLVKKFDLFDRVLEEIAPEHVNIKRVTRVPSVEKDDRYDYEEIKVDNNNIILFGKAKSDLKLAEDIAKQYKNDGVTYSYSKSGNWRGPDKAVKLTITVPVKESK